MPGEGGCKILLSQAICAIRASYAFKQWEAIAVRKTTCRNHDQVNEPPDTATTRRQQLNNTYCDVAGIETVNAKNTQENT